MIDVINVKHIIRTHILTDGWTNVFVDFDDSDHTYSYSIGFEESFNHPEIVIFDMPQNSAYSVIERLAGQISEGRVMEPNVRVDNVLRNNVVVDGFDVFFIPLKEKHGIDFEAAEEYYEKPFRVLAMFWPDMQNRLPMDQGYSRQDQIAALDLVLRHLIH